ncbi:MAG: hypothetical protein DCC50_08825 [Acidobacteria bacterium]|nr:MAG: hypothetical protein DCC50_08825 [Acidobacteriota bacterium]
MVLTSVVLRRAMAGVSRLVGHAVVYSVLCAAVALVTVAAVALLGAADVELRPAATGLLAAVVAVGLLPLRVQLRRLLVRARQGREPSEEELVRSLTEQLLRSRQQVVAAREEERGALRRELHDVLGPSLAGLRMQLGALPPVVRSDPQAAVDRLGRLEQAAGAALEDVRRLSRGLRPTSLDELGLTAALEDVAEQQGLRLAVQAEGLPTLPAGVEVAAYRIGSEALTNAARHSGTGSVDLHLQVRDGALVVRVSDRGTGARAPSGGVGTTSMRQRAAELGGVLTVRDTEGGGTTVEARLPLGTAAT